MHRTSGRSQKGSSVASISLMSPEDEVRTEWPFGGASVSDQWSRWYWAHMALVVMRSWWGHHILVSDRIGETWTSGSGLGRPESHFCPRDVQPESKAWDSGHQLGYY